MKQQVLRTICHILCTSQHIFCLNHVKANFVVGANSILM